ncbi:unnamed protein product, partial [Discosporangium mesarthrocarpum]
SAGTVGGTVSGGEEGPSGGGQGKVGMVDDGEGNGKTPGDRGEGGLPYRSDTADSEENGSLMHGGTSNRGPSPTLRRHVLGVVMNLTTASLSHPRMDPQAIMSALAMVMDDDDDGSGNGRSEEDMGGDMCVMWLSVILQLSFVKAYRPLIVHHSEGQVFTRIKGMLTNDPLMGSSSGMVHEQAYRQLTMGTMVNLAQEQSLYEELEGQVQVLREFLAECENE